MVAETGMVAVLIQSHNLHCLVSFFFPKDCAGLSEKTYVKVSMSTVSFFSSKDEWGCLTNIETIYLGRVRCFNTVSSLAGGPSSILSTHRVTHKYL